MSGKLAGISGIDNKQIDKTLRKVMRAFNKGKLNIVEQLIMLGNLLYSVGASQAGYKGQGPSVPELEKKYYEKPTAATTLMLTGLQIILYAETTKEKKE